VTEKPDVQPHAIEQADAERAAAVGKDAQGNSYDPNIHAQNPDGSPRKTVRGTYALKRGRKGGKSPTGAAPTQSANGVILPGASANMSAKEQESRHAGAAAANLMLAVSVGIGGEEWQPVIDDKTGKNEKLMLEMAFGDYFAAKQWGDLPPGLALCAAVCMYAVPRFGMPKTKTRMQRFKEWLGAKYGAWKGRAIARRRGMPLTDIEKADLVARKQFRQESAAHEAGKAA
jgi:hypothetical protein